ncbi:MAG: ABC transporter substrate-binding protein [Rhizobiaceae bacterium]
MKSWLTVAAAAVVAVVTASTAFAQDVVRIGALKFGTVNWELDTIAKNGLDARNGVKMQITYFAGEDASNIAFQAGDVDMIVTDWLEVARLRGQGQDVTFAPYSSSTGAIMVKADSPIKSLADIKGKKLAVAGGALDKSWLLLQGMAAKQGFDIAKENEIIYGAPPLLAEKLRAGEFDAALNYWHFNARLEADGFRRIVGADDASKDLGAAGIVSTLGYAFHDKWAAEHMNVVFGFLKASREAKVLLKDNDAEWTRLHADGVIKDDGAALDKLRDRYRDGIPARPALDEEADAAKLFEVLAGLGGEKLVGSAKTLPAGTYWPALKDVD